jgi:hypothetical protein
VSIKPDQVFGPDCDWIAKGIPIQLFRRDAVALDPTLRRIDIAPPSGFKHKVLTSGKKLDYIAYLLSRGVAVCDQDQFCLRNRMLNMKVQPATLCPWWDGHRSIKIHLDVDYAEAVNPTFPENAPQVHYDVVFDKDSQPFEQTFETGEVVGRFTGFEDSPGKSSFNLKIELIPDPLFPTLVDPLIRFTATAMTDKTESELFFPTQPQVQVQNIGCEDNGTYNTGFVYRPDGIGRDVFFFWVVEWFPHGPIGLVLSLSFSVFASGWND